MTQRKFDLILGTVLILLVAASRLLPFIPPNFTALTGLSLFSGFLFRLSWRAFIVPMGSLFLSDLVLGLHSTMPWVYASFAMGIFLGQRLKKAAWSGVLGLALMSSVLFFVVTNFGVWTEGVLYPRNWSGLIQCYAMAVPFFRNSLSSDLLSTAMIFGIFRSISHWSYRHSEKTIAL